MSSPTKNEILIWKWGKTGLLDQFPLERHEEISIKLEIFVKRILAREIGSVMDGAYNGRLIDEMLKKELSS